LLARHHIRGICDVKAGIVDENGDVAKRTGHAINHAKIRVAIRDVVLDEERARAGAAELFGRGFSLRGVSARDRHRGARARKPLRNRITDAAIAAGDDRDATGQIEQLHLPLPPTSTSIPPAMEISASITTETVGLLSMSMKDCRSAQCAFPASVP